MTRTFLKKKTAIGVIQKQMIVTQNCINLYTITENDGCTFDGSIEVSKEDYVSAEWKERGFVEITE